VNHWTGIHAARQFLVFALRTVGIPVTQLLLQNALSILARKLGVLALGGAVFLRVALNRKFIRSVIAIGNAIAAVRHVNALVACVASPAKFCAAFLAEFLRLVFACLAVLFVVTLPMTGNTLACIAPEVAARTRLLTGFWKFICGIIAVLDSVATTVDGQTSNLVAHKLRIRTFGRRTVGLIGAIFAVSLYVTSPLLQNTLSTSATNVSCRTFGGI